MLYSYMYETCIYIYFELYLKSIDQHGLDGPWVVYFQNCVRWPRPPSKMAAMSRHSFNVEPYGSMGFE